MEKLAPISQLVSSAPVAVLVIASVASILAILARRIKKATYKNGTRLVTIEFDRKGKN